MHDREEEHWGEVQAGEHARENRYSKPEEGPPPIGERPCRRCGVMLMLHRGDQCPALRRSA